MQEKKYSFIEENKLFVLIFTILITGIIAGSVTYRYFDVGVLTDLSEYADSFQTQRTTTSFFQLFTDTLSDNSFLLIFLFICGFCSIAQPVEFLAPFYKGLGLGAGISQIYMNKGSKGVLIVAVLIVPYAVIICSALLFAVKESIRYSNRYFIRGVSSRNRCGLAYYTKSYCIRYLLYEILILIGSLVDALCSFLFADLLFR